MENIKSQNPLAATVSIGKESMIGFGKIVLLCILIAIINLIFFIIGIYRLTQVDFESIKILYLILSLIVGLGSVALTASLGNQYCFILTLKNIYKELNQVVYKICERIVIQAEKIFHKNKEENDERKISADIHLKDIIDAEFPSLPGFVKKGLVFVLNRTPIPRMLISVKHLISSGKRKDATDHFFQQMDQYIQEEIFGENSMSWYAWLMGINVAGQILIVWFLI